MKRILFLMGLLLPVCSAKAQNTVSRTCVRYEQRHVVCTNEKGEMNVVDMDFEWPERLCYVTQPVLLQHINALLGDTCTALDRKIAAIQARYGQPLQAKLDTIPDDSKFCYATYSVREVGLQEGRYISMRVEKQVQPGANSSQKQEHRLELFVYDITNQRILQGKDVLKTEEIMENPAASFYLSEALTKGLLSDYAVSLDAQKLYGPVPVNDGTLLMEVGSEGKPTVQSMFPTADWTYSMASKFKKLLKSKPVMGTPVEQSDTLSTVDSLYVYRQTDVAASFSWCGKTLGQYIIDNLVLPPYIKNEVLSGHALARVVVERDGSLSHLSVVSPLSPSFDRSIIALLARMPKWSPALKNGQAVRSLCFIPVNFRLQ